MLVKVTTQVNIKASIIVLLVSHFSYNVEKYEKFINMLMAQNYEYANCYIKGQETEMYRSRLSNIHKKLVGII